jgi:uncharacterized protein YqgC (DUF456 family)
MKNSLDLTAILMVIALPVVSMLYLLGCTVIYNILAAYNFPYSASGTIAFFFMLAVLLITILGFCLDYLNRKL